MKGAGYHGCHRCLAERPFYGALEDDALSSLSVITFLLRLTIFKPICVECGTSINWRAQEFLYRGDHRRVGQAKDGQAGAARVTTIGAIPGQDRGIAHQGLELAERLVEPVALAESTIDWQEKGFSHVGLLCDGGVLKAKLKTDLNYLNGSYLMRGEDTAVVRRSAAAIGHYENWLEIYRQTGWCLRPFRLPKWKAISRIPIHQQGSALAFTAMPRTNAVLAVGQYDIAYVNVDAPLISKFCSHSELFGYTRPSIAIYGAHICHDERHVILAYSDWSDPERPAKGMLALDLLTDLAPTDFGVVDGEYHILDEADDLLLTASGNEATIHVVGNWKETVVLQCDGEITEGRFSRSGKEIILRTRTPIGQDDEPLKVEYEIWQLT
ncbi:hypothetical protein J3E64_002691 [Sphingobium sp. OAS761]|uniref:hypothetical protein n=1 Tax=Sphingobium sp. OAS761 TaxID=2817901 RepID=UPI0020A0A7B2|nr:hypothetical protein [Sphingobium sp. OAS761]MCP1470994.1 hypothetical protein [Sphingobium sp. OAS761]